MPVLQPAFYLQMLRYQILLPTISLTQDLYFLIAAASIKVSVIIPEAALGGIDS